MAWKGTHSSLDFYISQLVYFISTQLKASPFDFNYFGIVRNISGYQIRG